jgi:bifunctional enzyme CysN/CysC
VTQSNDAVARFQSQRQIAHLNAAMATAARISRETRIQRQGHPGAIIWLTGLSGAGKSTLATAAEACLFDRGYLVYILDGDELRRGISADLGFSASDRHENVRRASEVAALLADAGLVVLVALISPFASDREAARRVGGSSFREVFVKASVRTCEGRDPRGLYRRARAGEIPEFTGISSPYEPPLAPDLIIDTEQIDVAAAVSRLVAFITECVPRTHASTTPAR